MSKRAVAIALLSFIGMFDALYLSLKRNAGPIPCHVTRGCTDVLTSRFSEVMGIPLSTFGLIFYIVVFSLAVFEIVGIAKTLDWVFWPAAVGIIISAILVGIQ